MNNKTTKSTTARTKTIKTDSSVEITTTKDNGDRKFIKLPNVGTPILDRVLVQQADADEFSAGGIIIPEVAKEKPSRGIVIAVGPGRKDEEMIVKPGDIVLYGKYAGTEVTIKGIEYLLMRQSDLLMII